MIKHSSSAVDISTVRPAVAPSPAHLDAWVGRPWVDGMQVDALHDLDMLLVRTMNTVYEITVVTARTGEVIVRGGRFFPEPTRAVILGVSHVLVSQDGCPSGGASNFQKITSIHR